jgi:hypothetical protein
MKKWTLVIALIWLAAGTAFADVSHEVVVGFEDDSTDEVTSSPTGTDLNGKLETSNSLFLARYTRYFAPLKTDDKPIELRRFYQHPANFSVGLALIGYTDKDSTVPAAVSDGKGSGSMLLLGGEYFFPSNTGLFLNIRSGSSTFEETVGGIAQPDVESEFSTTELGVRQYVIPNVELHLRLHGETTESTPGGQPKSTITKSVTYLGAQGVIKNVVGLLFELGGGEREDESAGTTIKYDIGAVNAEVAGYIGKQISVRFAIEVESADMAEPPAGVEHTTTIARTTLAARYWFSERFGMELPLYSETIEKKNVVAGIESKETMKNGGIGLYGSFRF